MRSEDENGGRALPDPREPTRAEQSQRRKEAQDQVNDRAPDDDYDRYLMDLDASERPNWSG